MEEDGQKNSNKRRGSGGGTSVTVDRRVNRRQREDLKDGNHCSKQKRRSMEKGRGRKTRGRGWTEEEL